MEPVALLINDIHVSKDNIDEFNKNWNEALSICDAKGIADIVIGGDLFTTRSSQTLSSLLAVKHALERATLQGVSVTIAEGNHCKVDQEAFEGYSHVFRGLKGIDIIDICQPMMWEGCNFALLVMSYFPEDGSFLERMWHSTEHFLAANKSFEKSDLILYIHQGVHGALGDFEIPGELPQEPFEGFKAVLCGHYHNRVKIKDTCIEYIGSSRQANFGEDEEKGYTILYSDGSYKFVKNNVNTRYKTIELTAAEAAIYKLEKKDRYKYRVKIKCSENDARLFDKQKMFDKGFDKVEIVAKSELKMTVESSDIQEKYDKHGIIKEYQNYCNENSIDSELGIKYLGE